MRQEWISQKSTFCNRMKKTLRSTCSQSDLSSRKSLTLFTRSASHTTKSKRTKGNRTIPIPIQDINTATQKYEAPIRAITYIHHELKWYASMRHPPNSGLSKQFSFSIYLCFKNIKHPYIINITLICVRSFNTLTFYIIILIPITISTFPISIPKITVLLL